MKKIFFLTVLFLFMFVTVSGNAADDRDVCFRKTIEYERREQIRPYILSTIAIVESGRIDADSPLGIYPWPWTVMADGKGRFFQNKNDAVAEVKKLKSMGKTNIDVGCMQINVGYHGNKFKNLEEMFDPDKNVAYAAKFVKSLYDKTGFWGDAATRYHSKTASKAERYELKLADAFSRIKNHILTGGELFFSKKKDIAATDKKLNKISGKAKVNYAKLLTPKIREKQKVLQNTTLRTASLDANLYRERKKNEYDLKKLQKNGKGS